MKKKLSALLSLVLACGMTFGMTACGGGGENPNTETDLEIFYWDSGNGSAWLDRTIDAFEKKYPEVNVVKNYRETNETWGNELPNPGINTIDLYINTAPTLLAYSEYLEPLNDVLKEKDENGTKLIDKMDASLLKGVTAPDGNIYATNWAGGVCGLVYNKTVFKKEGYKVPRTTDELADLAADMVDDEYTPFIFPGNADYWIYCYLPWAAQYGGIDEINDFWKSQYNGEISKDAFLTDARKEALMALEDVAGPKGYTYKSSNAINHTTAQTQFLQGVGLMMPNGSWLENEMRNTSSKVEMEFMKTPIISALADKLEINEKILREVVSYVDSEDYAKGKLDESSKEYSASRVKAALDKEADNPNWKIEAVAAARKIVYTEAPSNKCYIPNYANAKEWAKEFIKFMNTEEGLACCYETLQTPMLTKVSTPVDTSDWSGFMKSALALTQGTEFVYRAKGSPFFYNNGLEFYPAEPQKTILAANSEDKLTAEQFWNTKCVKTYNDNWKIWFERSGLDK